MKNFPMIWAVVTACVLAVPVSAGTLKMTFEANYSISVGPTASNSTNPAKLSPILTLGFANATDYSALANPSAGPKFGAADLVSVEWDRLENLHVSDSPSDPDNPPMTQALFDSLTFKSGSAGGNFAPVTGTLVLNSLIYFAENSTTNFQTGPMLLLRMEGFSLNPITHYIRLGGNWDDDVFDDSSRWQLVRTSIEWDASATSFDTVPTDPVSAVPLPAGFPLLLAGLGAFSLVRRRRLARMFR